MRPSGLDRHVQHLADQADPGKRSAGYLSAKQPLTAYRSISAPVLVIGFGDDLVTPPHLSREVANAMPNGRYVEIPDAGHLGFFERPEAVNAAMLKFFADDKAWRG